MVPGPGASPPRPRERTAGAIEVAPNEGNEMKRDEHAGVGVARSTDEAGEPLPTGLGGGKGRSSYRSKKGPTSETLCSGNVTTKLRRIAELANTDRQRALTSVAHVIDLDWLREAYRRTRKDGAPGVDGKTATEFAADLEQNLGALATRLRAGTYRPPPVRRVHIPKGNGTTRPIGVPTFEDKVAQRAVAMVLEAIYETEFLDVSYGFRPGRSAHQALEELQRRPTYWTKCWVIEADIERFFDGIDHGLLRSVLDRRVRDGVLRRLIDRWLQAGVMESGQLTVPDEGTPQGGVISPLLANVFLHDVLDLWVEDTVRPRLRGKLKLIRKSSRYPVLRRAMGGGTRPRLSGQGCAAAGSAGAAAAAVAAVDAAAAAAKSQGSSVSPRSAAITAAARYWAGSRRCSLAVSRIV